MYTACMVAVPSNFLLIANINDLIRFCKILSKRKFELMVSGSNLT